MAKFLPTINLWDPSIDAAIRNGQLKLQCGQWVRCGNDSQKSRWVRYTGQSMHIAHGANNREVCKRFDSFVKAKKLTLKRCGKL